ncbi:hypothetical protein AB0M41_28265 [Streptomyces sp. NPDC051896]|uniref:hypothetical protein n=1 Tax=Streptomyces sp. NPDC051896 TaxID=3155416 RepID=UPI0034184489
MRWASLGLSPPTVLAQLLTAALRAFVARRRWGRRCGGGAVSAGPAGLNPEDAQADRGRWGAAGVAVALAFLTKRTGGAVLLPVAWLPHRQGAYARARCGSRQAVSCRLPGAAVPTDSVGFLVAQSCANAGLWAPGRAAASAQYRAGPCHLGSVFLDPAA